MSAVDVVVVTYGERWHFLCDVLSSIDANPLVGNVFVVDNGCSYSVAERVREQGRDNTHVLRMDDNLGSAGGFAAGVKAAVSRSENPLLWLLDDDNRPDATALQRLLACHELLGRDPAYLLLAHRPSRTEQREALEGRRPWVRKNSFVGFHLAEVLAKLRKKLARHEAAGTYCAERLPLVSLRYAPYGGLLLHKSWIEKAGLPAREFFLYGDDHEFTSRLVSAGATIILCGTSVVRDLETSWALKRTSSAPALISKHSDPRRLYLTVRNRAFWESRQFVDSKLVYFLNMAVYLAFLAVIGLLVEGDIRAVAGRLGLLLNAIRAGRRGRLGPPA